MELLGLLILGVLAWRPGSTWAAESAGNASEGLLEFSVGRFRYVSLSRAFPKEAILRDIPSNVSFLIIQIHSQHQNTTISFSKVPLPNASATGMDTGLVLALQPEQSQCSWHLQTGEAGPVQSLAVPLSYTERDPVPGGCNLEFDLDVDPNIYVEYDFFETTIKFAPANLGSARGVNPLPCDVSSGQDSRWRLQYDIYQYFLPEGDLTEGAALQHLQRMAGVAQVAANALKVVTLTEDDKTTMSFSSLGGQGVIYNVIVRDPILNTSAAYVPVHTYACGLGTPQGGCSTLELFFMGFIIAGFLFYILVTRVTPAAYDVRLILTAVVGCIGGLLVVAVWWRFGTLLLCLLCPGMVLGTLGYGVLLLTPMGNLGVFQDDAVYWVAFCLMALIVPVIFLACLRVMNILACGLVGSYTVVLAVGSYSYTSLSFITLNILKRALYPDFRRAFTSVPLQTNDFILLAVWGMLAVSGITLQIRRELGQPPFPPHPYKLWKREQERRVTNVLDPSYHIPPLRERLFGQLAQIKELFQKEESTGERTPLLL
ncbi:transmembrane 7 superfamily member 3 isoform X2 [Erinaceus europaeus]|uniref:Transmembrane 7 superfamily member 3 isoform X2 n=1 Tax=Erinaceus europaeus TaxID=9365 RepID=A0ABM3XP16_ERIEU|nr:transmembrane 7 superfamily member 3 isoform X2 [Erinaceus europaeus]